jgi:hypothetical protein
LDGKIFEKKAFFAEVFPLDLIYPPLSDTDKYWIYGRKT